MKRVSSFTVIVAFVCLALVGVALIPLLPVKLNPSRSLPGFTVGFSMPGTSSRVVEMEVTSKLESMLARIRGVKRRATATATLLWSWTSMPMSRQSASKLPPSSGRRGPNCPKVSAIPPFT